MTKLSLRTLPAIDQLLLRPQLQEALARLPRSMVVKAARAGVEQARSVLRSQSGDQAVEMGPGWVEERVLQELAKMVEPSLRPVINATGVILHTNLGRAPIGAEILERSATICSGYSNLEYDLESRQRGSRHQHVEELLRVLLGVEAAIVVNNCAAAVLLMLSGLARGKQVVVSRGELVEIGGSFRIPEVMEQSGATLREVGTTNRTHPADYERAICNETAVLMKAYRSNFAIVGFTEEVSRADLAQLAHQHGLIAVEDLGSGLLVDLKPYGVKDAVTVQEAVGAGLDVVCFSGDKLLGGPQAGILVGKEPLIRKLRAHPLMRALRTDKWTLATLEATLISYVDGTWTKKVPTMTLLTDSETAVLAKAQTAADILNNRAAQLATFEIHPSTAKVGGGTLPLCDLQSYAVVITPHHTSSQTLDETLRQGKMPVITRLENDKVYLDFRSVLANQVKPLAEWVVRGLEDAKQNKNHNA